VRLRQCVDVHRRRCDGTAGDGSRESVCVA
jgi:hypothetical protein